MGQYGHSLRVLQLFRLRQPAVEALSQLRSLTGITTLSIQGAREMTGPPSDVCEEVSTWLQECPDLKYISFICLSSAHQIITPLLDRRASNLSKLRSLVVIGYDMTSAVRFHETIGCAGSIQKLILQANGDLPAASFNALTMSLCSLARLRTLKLMLQMPVWDSKTVGRLIHSCCVLQVLHLRCESTWIEDGAVEELCHLRRLKELVFVDNSDISASRDMSIIRLETLVRGLRRPGHQGFKLHLPSSWRLMSIPGDWNDIEVILRNRTGGILNFV